MVLSIIVVIFIMSSGNSDTSHIDKSYYDAVITYEGYMQHSLREYHFYRDAMENLIDDNGSFGCAHDYFNRTSEPNYGSLVGQSSTSGISFLLSVTMLSISYFCFVKSGLSSL